MLGKAEICNFDKLPNDANAADRMYYIWNREEIMHNPISRTALKDVHGSVVNPGWKTYQYK